MMHTMSEIGQWLLFIKTRNDTIRQGLAKDNPIIAKANEALKNFYLTEEDKRAYLITNNARSDWASIRGDGKREGLEEGMKQGSYNTKLETAKRLLEMGLSIPDIMRAPMLTEKEIKTL